MELKDWQERLIGCISEGSWQSCSQEVRSLFDEVSLTHMDVFAVEKCDEDFCEAITKIIVTDSRLTLLIRGKLVSKAPAYSLRELRTWLAKEGDALTSIVVGHSGDKLFANIVSPDVVNTSAKECVERNGIEVCRVERDYDYLDMDYEEVVITPEMLHSPLRIQGDLTIEYVGPLRSLADLYVPSAATVREVLHSLVELALVRAGIVFERRGDRCIVRALHANTPGAYAIAKALHDTISQHIPAELDRNRIKLGFGNVEVFIRTDPIQGNSDIIIRSHYECFIDFEVDMSKFSGVLKPLADAYYNAINSLQRTTSKTYVGNHLVEIRDSYPLTFMVPVTLKIGGIERTYMLTAAVRENHFYADEHTELIIRHPEHGETRVRFVVPGVYRFNHVPHRRDIILNNTAVIRQFIRSVVGSIRPELIINEWDGLIETVYAMGKIKIPVEIEIKGDHKRALSNWVVYTYGSKRVSFNKDHIIVSDGRNSVLIRYEVRGNKVVIRSFERP